MGIFAIQSSNCEYLLEIFEMIYKDTVAFQACVDAILVVQILSIRKRKAKLSVLFRVGIDRAVCMMSSLLCFLFFF